MSISGSLNFLSASEIVSYEAGGTRIFGVFKDTKKVLVAANINRTSYFWWTYNISSGVSNSSFYLYNILI